MKKLIIISLFVLPIFILNSCTSSEKSWHESARIMGVGSVYIHKDGTKTTGEEWYKNHPEEDKKFQEKYGKDANRKRSINSSQVFVGMD
ncbi:MAG: hypothetical protein EBT63_06735 [Proteobacteria bacterium]|jgi:hypothetical protein|nr:hypothetical protein [Pseudomonadota bacterium]NCA28966.1 hypothetical protein [Pseudomonadota bacterium]